MRRIREIPAKIGAGFRSFLRDVAEMRGTNVGIFIMYGLLFDMVNNLWRPFSARFLERLGGGEFEIALLSALPGAVGTLVLLPGAALFRRFTNKKRATAAFILISRAVLLLIAFLPMFPAEARPLLFVIFVAIMNCPDALSQTSLQSLLGEIFSGTQRGQAIALRTKFGQAMIPLVTISSGLAITFIPNTDEQRMVLYQIFFVAAFVLGVAEVTVFNRLSAPQREQNERVKGPCPLRGSGQRPENLPLKKILTNKKFLKFLIPAGLFLFTWQSAWPLVNIFMVIERGANELDLAIVALVMGLTAFVSGGFWQRLLRRRGNTVIFVAAGFLLAVNMFIFPFVPNMQVMAAVHVIPGFAAVGINSALLNGALESTPDKDRMMYLAFYNTAQNLSLFVAPFFAHAMFTRVGLFNAMFAIGVLRIFSTSFVWFKMRKPVG